MTPVRATCGRRRERSRSEVARWPAAGLVGSGVAREQSFDNTHGSLMGAIETGLASIESGAVAMLFGN